MDQSCLDVFEEYDLPFKTFFARDVEHLNQTHDDTELIWVIRGTALVICNGRKYSLGPQTLFMVNAGQNHSVISPEEALIISYRFSRDYLIKNNFHFKNMQFVNRVYFFSELVGKYKEIPLLIAQLIKLLISEKNSFLIRYKIIGYYNILIYELYTLLLKEKFLDIKKKNCQECLKRVSTIIEYVSNNFNKNITLNDLAGKIGLSRYRLSHFVKDQMGISFRDYVTSIRLENALKLLRESEMKVLDISRVSGFSDVKYLNQLVKNKFNVTALKYRKLNREKGLCSCISKLKMDVFLHELRSCLSKIEAGVYG